MNLTEFIDATGINLHKISQGSGVSYSTLINHTKHGHQLTLKTAQKLFEFDQRLAISDVLGISDGKPARAPRERAGA